MNPFLYELKRTATSKTVIIATLVVVAISFFSAISSASGPTGQLNYDGYTAYGYGSNGTYGIVIFISNSYGQPVQGSNVIVSLGNNTSISEYTDSNGYANFTLNSVNSTVVENPFNHSTWDMFFNFTGSSNQVNFGAISMYGNYSNPYFFNESYISKLPGGKVTSGFNNISRYDMFPKPVQGQPIDQSVQILYEGPIGTPSPKVMLYYLPLNGTNGRTTGGIIHVSNLTEDNMTYFGTYSGFSNVILNVQNLKSSNISYYYFALFTPSGKLISFMGTYIKQPAPSQQVTQQFYGTQMSIMGLFIPLVAAISAYSTYGSDKLNGTLESVLVRPVSRRSLIISRYSANVAAVFIATLIAFAVSSYVYSKYLGNTFPVLTFVSGLWSLFVIVAAYVGLVFLASNFLKSQASLLGFAIGIFFIFDFVWTFSGFSLIPPLVASTLLHLPYGGAAYLRVFVDMYYISPAGLPNITSLLITGSSYYTIYVSTTMFSELGLSFANAVIDGLLWVIVPVTLSVIAFTRRG